MPYIPKLEDIRLDLGLSQAKLAQKASIDRGTVARCEKGFDLTDLSCRRIKKAIEQFAEKSELPVPQIRIDPLGKNGAMPRKSTKRRRKS